MDNFALTGDTFLQSRGTATSGAASESRVFIGQTATQAITVGNNLVGLTAGTGANEIFEYAIDGTGYTTTTGSTGNTINTANTGAVNVPIDTSSVGLKGGSVTVTPTATANNFSVNGTAGNSPVVLSTSAVAVVEKRVVTPSNTVNFGTVIAGTPVSGTANFATTGTDDTKTRVSLATGTIAPNGDGIGMDAGGTGSLFDDAADTASRTLGGSFVTVGLKSGSVGVGITGENLTGEGGYADVQAGYSATVLDHSNGSFDGAIDSNSVALPSVGSIDVNQTYTGSLTVYNLQSDLDGSLGGDYTADLQVKGVSYVSGDNLGLTIDPSVPVDANGSVTFNFQFIPTMLGAFTSTYSLTAGDIESILGWSNNAGGLSFTIAGTVVDPSAVPEPLTAAGVILLASRVLGRRARVSL